MNLVFWPFDGARRRREKRHDQEHDERMAGLNLALSRQEGSQQEPTDGAVSNEVSRYLAEREEGARRGGESPLTGAPPREGSLRELQDTPVTCFKCGGLCIASKLQHQYTVTIFNDPGSIREPDVKKTSYCGSCLPTSNLEIVLANRYGEAGVLDTVYFSTNESYLQPFDFQGVEQTLISAEDFTLLWCGDCDQLVHPSKNRKCRKCITADAKKT